MLHAGQVKVNRFFQVWLYRKAIIGYNAEWECEMRKRENQRKGKKTDKSVYQALTTISQFGIYMLVPIFLCSFLGILLDRKMGTSCFFMIVLFFAGALAGFRNVFLLAKRIYSGKEERTPYGEKKENRDS